MHCWTLPKHYSAKYHTWKITKKCSTPLVCWAETEQLCCLILYSFFFDNLPSSTGSPVLCRWRLCPPTIFTAMMDCTCLRGMNSAYVFRKGPWVNLVASLMMRFVLFSSWVVQSRIWCKFSRVAQLRIWCKFSDAPLIVLYVYVYTV
jgi:hypothetical protein